ncbi:MAG: peptidylprolyl isomerase [Planctomycetota bacterium]
MQIKFHHILLLTLFLLPALSGCDLGIEKQGTPVQLKPANVEKIDTPPTNWTRGERGIKDAPTKGEFKVKFETSKGDFVMLVHRDWAPLGAERFYQLIENKYYDGAPFYRVVVGFMVQFGMNGDPLGTQYWDKNIPDDPVKQNNSKGRVTYAMSGPNTRSTQLFINYANNQFLNGQGFAPFAEVVEGMDTVESLNAQYAEEPSQAIMYNEGNQYVFKNFPNIDYIISASFVDDSDESAGTEKESETKPDDIKPDEKSESAVQGDSDSKSESPQPPPAKTEKEGAANSVDQLEETITFQSADGVSVTANAYCPLAKSAPFIVLCHQAGWSRGEYREIAPKLNEMGFNCMAIDQRSGGEVNGIKNATMVAAESEGKSTNFTDAEQDIIAAIEYAKKTYADGKLILWGSSYSSALAIRIAGENEGLVDGVLAFAPGEYFQRFGKPADWVTRSAKNLNIPVFITSAKAEQPKWASIYEAIPSETKTSFVPETKGNHGSRALWIKFEDSDSYWKATREFLSQYN